MFNVELVDLTEDRFEEALNVFVIGGWEEESLLYVKAEMKAFLNGDIEGYIRARFILAIVNGGVIGVAAWAPSMCGFSVYELSWATVVPKWRHLGINSLMLQERIRRIRVHHGTAKFNVIVCTWANPMYTRAGFVSIQDERGRQPEDRKDKCLLLAQFETLLKSTCD
ncbi:GNAT family N-acetyltransferase [Sporomusa sp.]|jgi:GNAT superfamily N-acetyltransferase|uniref:GNAT family N-acetyltransferase n=1 Tax=Sporomusa sp. TaxID=2078658 RepID=UPI002D1DE55B|nr:GNAT family N-acetyltransferase [Sporomusa sp.]HWR07894.1 GNAT family N-acetyltransferase [Sporomusa sp.]